MVRCSKVVIVQLLAVLAVLGLLNFYFTNTEAQSAKGNLSHKFSDREKFRPSDTGQLPAKVHHPVEEAVSHKVMETTETAYKLTTHGDVSHGPVFTEIQEQLKMNNDLLLKELEEEKKKEEEEKHNKEQEERLKKEQEERLKKEQEEKLKKEQEEKLKKEQEEKLKKEQEEKLKKEQEQKEEDESKPPQSAEQTILERMKRVKEVCKRLNYPTFNQFNMYHFRKYGGHGISWCPTFKASSSTWRDFFIDDVLGSRASFMGVHYHLGVLGNQILTRGMNRGSSTRKRTFSGESDGSIRFTVVRHPISRLISHLRKAENYPYEVRAQRGDWVEESIMEGRTDPSWDPATRQRYKREWDNYLSEIGSNSKHAAFSESNPYLHPPYPVFPELINFVMKHRPSHDDKGNNGHWRPTIEWCDLCQNDLDIIIQLEEEPEELLYLLEKLGMFQFKDKFLSKHNSSSNKSASKDEINEYVKQLNKEQVNYLNKMYAADFEMLGYDPIGV